MKTLKIVYQSYQASNESLSSREMPLRFRMVNLVMLSAYVVMIVSLETWLHMLLGTTEFADRLAVILALSIGFLVIHRTLENYVVRSVFKPRFDADWSMVIFYRADWLFLRYLLFKEHLNRLMDERALKVHPERLEVVAKFCQDEADKLGKLASQNLGGRFLGYGLGLAITLLGKLSASFSHPMLINLLVVIGALLLFGNLVSSRFRSRTRKTQEVHHFLNWYTHELTTQNEDAASSPPTSQGSPSAL